MTWIGVCPSVDEGDQGVIPPMAGGPELGGSA